MNYINFQSPLPTESSQAAVNSQKALFSCDGKFLQALNPFWAIKFENNKSYISESFSESQLYCWKESETDALTQLESFWAHEIKGTNKILLGFLGYDYAGQLEVKVIDEREALMPFPSLFFTAYENFEEKQMREVLLPLGNSEVSFKSLISDDEYKDMVKQAIDLIESGQIYEVNLSRPFVFEFNQSVSSLKLFELFYSQNPMPFAAHLPIDGDRAICSLSPECFLMKQGEKVSTFPIKGTRRKLSIDEADLMVQKELLNDEKEKAEHLMVVDLERNDLGKVCVPASVKVDEFMQLKSFVNLHHLVSTVSGQLRPSLNIFDVLKATFPSGSITGAPKIRAMQIIKQLEPFSRSAYTGALGYIDGKGDGCFSILIRSLLLNGKQAVLNTGGGIVYDSKPAFECEETHLKAETFVKALK